MPSSDHDSHATLADAIADAVCLRRVIHALGAMIATWLLYGLTLSRFPQVAEDSWWWAAPVVISALATWFAAWAVFFGDRKVWSRAFGRAARQDRTS